jgi:hypothetical protein
VHEVDRHKVYRAKPTVDPAHKLVHCRAQVLILFYILPRGNRKLREHDLSENTGIQTHMAQEM